MGLVYDITNEKIAKDFVENMLGMNTNLNVFIKLNNMWDRLTTEQRELVIEQCRTTHASAHQFEPNNHKHVHDSMGMYHYICTECGVEFEEPQELSECKKCGSKVENLVKYICNECGFEFLEPNYWEECNDCNSKDIRKY